MTINMKRITIYMKKEMKKKTRSNKKKKKVVLIKENNFHCKSYPGRHYWNLNDAIGISTSKILENILKLVLIKTLHLEELGLLLMVAQNSPLQTILFVEMARLFGLNYLKIVRMKWTML